MKALFVESGLELRILTDQFIKDYFNTGIIVTTTNDRMLKAFASLKAIPLIYLEMPVTPISSFLYPIEQIQKIRLQKKLKSKSSVKLSKTYQFLRHFPISTLGLLFNILYFLYRNSNDKPIWGKLKSILIENQIEEIIFAGHIGITKELASKVAKSCQIKTFVIQNSWKDLFINPFLQFHIDKMNVWSQDMANVYTYLNPQQKQIKWIIGWHPRLLELYGDKPKEEIKKNQKIIILYTCANPKIVSDELQILEKIILTLGGEFQFIVRPNPQDNNPARWNILAYQYTNCKINLPEWYWNHQTKINIPGQQSEEDWKKLLYECSIVMNIASTVTLEALLVQKSVVNITFGPDGKPSELIQSQTFLPYYEGMLHHPNVFVCNCHDELNKIILKALSTKFSNNPVKQYLISRK